MPHKRITIERQVDGRSPLEIEIAVHPLSNGIIVVNYPGIKGDIDGYNKKYVQLADLLQEKGVGAVVRMENKIINDIPYPQSMIDNFTHVLDYSIGHSADICGTKDPKIYLMGMSAGASTIASVAADYSQVEKILLMAPSGDAGMDNIRDRLAKFTGEVYVTIGENDEVVKSWAGKWFYDCATNARKKELEIIPDCDHQFRGRVNGKIMSKAPLWAFAGDRSFPSPGGGKKLYD